MTLSTKNTHIHKRRKLFSSSCSVLPLFLNKQAKQKKRKKHGTMAPLYHSKGRLYLKQESVELFNY